jgi:hypothetical protein
MLSIESLTVVVFVVSIVAFIIGVCLFGIAHDCKLSFKQHILLLILQICVALSLIVIWALYCVETDRLVQSSKNTNEFVFTTKTSCIVVEIRTIYDVSHNNNNFAVYYITQSTNATKYHYNGVCALGIICWPNVNTSIVCWPVIENSVVTDYVMNPPLSDTKYYEIYKATSILMTMVFAMLSLSLIVSSSVNCANRASSIEEEGVSQSRPQQLEWYINQQALQLEGVSQQQQSNINDGSIILEFVEGNPSTYISSHINAAPSEISDIPVFQSVPNSTDVRESKSAVPSKSVNTCSVCYVTQSTIMYDKCHHVCMCEACDNKYNSNRCPICSQVSAEKVKLFFS